MVSNKFNYSPRIFHNNLKYNSENTKIPGFQTYIYAISGITNISHACTISKKQNF